MTYDSKLENSNEDDSFDRECGYHYVRIGKDWDNDGDGHRYNHSLETIQYIDMQSDGYTSGDFMFYTPSQYFAANINNTSNINDTTNDGITSDTQKNTCNK